MKTRNLTCIVCPRGCALSVSFDPDGAVASVEGNACPRGKDYAVDECTHPKRTVTSTVRCADGSVVAVKTSATVPKERVFDVMREINSTVAKCGLKVGEIVIPNVLSLGVDVVATANGK